jgi:hypothetical protein
MHPLVPNPKIENWQESTELSGRNFWVPSKKYFPLNVMEFTGDIRIKLQKILGKMAISHRLNSIKIREIHDRFLEPEHLNKDAAIDDLEFLIFSVYKEVFFWRHWNENEVYIAKKRLAKLAIFLRKLSNTSGIIWKRSSGQTAYSHWIEAVYIYIQNDPSPTIDGLMRVGSHDTIEDPDFETNTSAQWTKERTVGKLEKLIWKENLQKVRDFHTKPRIERIWLNQQDNLILRISSHFPDQYERTKTEIQHKRKLERNRHHLSKIQHELTDTYFLEKMADALSNVRNLDAFSIDGNTQEGITKIRRKCMEIVTYYLPRIQNLHDGYFCQFYTELMSLNTKFHLLLPLNEWLEQVFLAAKRRILKKGDIIIEVESRTINTDIWYCSNRKSLSILRGI